MQWYLETSLLLYVVRNALHIAGQSGFCLPHQPGYYRQPHLKSNQPSKQITITKYKSKKPTTLPNKQATTKTKPELAKGMA